jgi:hypothetical protein
MAELIDCLDRIIVSLKKCEIDYVIVGSVAAILRGRIRTTGDVDLIIQNDEQKFWNFLHTLKENGFDYTPEQAKYSLEERFNFSVFDTKSAMRIDLKLARSDFDTETLRSAVSENYQGILIKLASIEQLLLGKAMYLGDISDEEDSELLEFNDVLDFITVYQIYKEKISVSTILDKIKSPNIKNTFQRLLELAKNDMERV